MDKLKLANFCSAQQLPVPLTPLQNIVDDQGIHDDPEPGGDNGEHVDGHDEPPVLDGIPLPIIADDHGIHDDPEPGGDIGDLMNLLT